MNPEFEQKWNERLEDLGKLINGWKLTVAIGVFLFFTGALFLRQSHYHTNPVVVAIWLAGMLLIMIGSFGWQYNEKELYLMTHWTGFTGKNPEAFPATSLERERTRDEGVALIQESALTVSRAQTWKTETERTFKKLKFERSTTTRAISAAYYARYQAQGKFYETRGWYKALWKYMKALEQLPCRPGTRTPYSDPFEYQKVLEVFEEQADYTSSLMPPPESS